jgi:hypothetical protein
MVTAAREGDWPPTAFTQALCDPPLRCGILSSLARCIGWRTHVHLSDL